jgi:hypothetical protein
MTIMSHNDAIFARRFMMKTRKFNHGSQNGNEAREALVRGFLNTTGETTGPLKVLVEDFGHRLLVFVGGGDGCGILQHMTQKFDNYDLVPLAYTGERLQLLQGSLFESEFPEDVHRDPEHRKALCEALKGDLANFNPVKTRGDVVPAQFTVEVPHDDKRLLFNVANLFGEKKVNLSFFRFDRYVNNKKLAAFFSGNVSEGFDKPDTTTTRFALPRNVSLFARLEVPVGVVLQSLKQETLALCPADAIVDLEPERVRK